MAVFIQVNGVTWQLAQEESPDELRERILAFADRQEQIHLQVSPQGGDGRETLTLDTGSIWSLMVWQGEAKKREVW